jgi:hypothetical protein
MSLTTQFLTSNFSEPSKVDVLDFYGVSQVTWADFRCSCRCIPWQCQHFWEAVNLQDLGMCVVTLPSASLVILTLHGNWYALLSISYMVMEIKTIVKKL